MPITALAPSARLLDQVPECRVLGAPKRLLIAAGAAADDVANACEEIPEHVGIDLDYETVGESMLMVSANGTAVRVE